MEEIVRRYFETNNYKEVSLYCYDNGSFHSTCLAENGRGNYIIVMGSIYNNKISSIQKQKFDQLTKYNIHMHTSA